MNPALVTIDELIAEAQAEAHAARSNNLRSEPGTSLTAAGWKCVGEAGGGTWNRASRQRVDTHPLEQKTLREAGTLTDG